MLLRFIRVKPSKINEFLFSFQYFSCIEEESGFWNRYILVYIAVTFMDIFACSFPIHDADNTGGSGKVLTIGMLSVHNPEHFTLCGLIEHIMAVPC